MSEPRVSTMNLMLLIHRARMRRRENSALAAARYWIHYGARVANYDYDYLSAWLDVWWSELPAQEQSELDAWMKSVHRAIDQDAWGYVAAQKEEKERTARAKAHLTQMAGDESTNQ